VGVDERLSEGLSRIPPADPGGAYERVVEKKVRRRVARKLEAAGLALVVIAGTVAGSFALYRAFEGVGDDVAAAGANGRIAYVDYYGSHEDGTWSDWRIFTMEPDGSDVTEIGPRGITEALYPAWSPDGSRIAFAGFQGQPPHDALYVMDTDGTNVRALFPLGGTDDQQIDDVAWSPDGSRIAFALSRPVGERPEFGPPEMYRSTIWTIAPDGSNPIEITSFGRETAMSWSPDGTELVVERSWMHVDHRGDPSNGLWIISAYGSSEELIASGDAFSDPAWSPDGSTIAYVDGDGQIALMWIDGSGIRRITREENGGYDPTWSPDGTRIAFVGRRLDPGYDESVCHLFTMRADGSNVRSLISAPGSEGCPGQGGISWGTATSPSPTPAGPTPSPSAPAEPTPSEAPAVGEDIGLDDRVCDVTSVRGEFGAPDVEGTAFVASILRDGKCPELQKADQVLAVDLEGDDLADISFDGLACDPWCHAWTAPDVDGDGTDEILVQNIQFSIAGLHLYDLVGEPPQVVPVTVEPPGVPGSFEPDEQPQLWYGGDAFNADALRCEGAGPARVLVSSTANQDPPESGPWYVHETTFRLSASVLEVIDARDYATDGYPFERVDGICGARNPYPGG
jgi:TolB protein